MSVHEFLLCACYMVVGLGIMLLTGATPYGFQERYEDEAWSTLTDIVCGIAALLWPLHLLWCAIYYSSRELRKEFNLFWQRRVGYEKRKQQERLESESKKALRKLAQLDEKERRLRVDFEKIEEQRREVRLRLGPDAYRQAAEEEAAEPNWFDEAKRQRE